MLSYDNIRDQWSPDDMPDDDLTQSICDQAGLAYQEFWWLCDRHDGDPESKTGKRLAVLDAYITGLENLLTWEG